VIDRPSQIVTVLVDGKDFELVMKYAKLAYHNHEWSSPIEAKLSSSPLVYRTSSRPFVNMGVRHIGGEHRAVITAGPSSGRFLWWH
jgi:hypothetical protein